MKLHQPAAIHAPQEAGGAGISSGRLGAQAELQTGFTATLRASSTSTEFLPNASEFSPFRVPYSGALAIKAERGNTVHDATDLLKNALDSGGATLIDVELDRAFKPM